MGYTVVSPVVISPMATHTHAQTHTHTHHLIAYLIMRKMQG